jgi:hypothetical protein
VFAAVEIFALVLWLEVGRSAWFFHDDWAFLAQRRASDLGDLFRPHNGHCNTLPIVVYRLLFRIFGVRTYFPYRLVNLVLYLTLAWLLFAVIRRAGVQPWIATAAASAFALLGAGWDNILRPFQIQFVGSLVFGLLQLLLVDHEGRFNRRDGLGLLAGFLGLMTQSSIAVVMVVVVGFALVLRRRWLVALAQTLPLGLCYLFWLIVIGHKGMRTIGPTARPLPPVGFGEAATSVERGLRATYDALSFPNALGIVLAGVVLVGVPLAAHELIRRGQLAQLAVPCALLAGSVLFLVLIATSGRAVGGFKTRYVGVTVAMTLPAVAVAVNAFAARWRWFMPLGIVLLIIGIPRNVHTATVAQKSLNPLYSASRHVLATLPRTPGIRQAPPTLRPEPDAANWVTVGWLLSAVAEHRFPVAGVVTRRDLDSNRFRLSFDEEPLRAQLTDCRLLSHPTMLTLRKGDVLEIGSETVRIRPGTDTIQVDPRMVFTPGKNLAIFVLHDVGRVAVDFSTSGSRSRPPRLCIK